MSRSTLWCSACETELPIKSRVTRCPKCAGLLEVRLTDVRENGAGLRRRFDERLKLQRGVERSGVWRYREVIYPAARDDEIVSHPEGNTPLIDRAAISDWAGVDGLLLKHEGHNPTGSFKDRGMTTGVTHAVRIGCRAIACASTGNTSASLAAYGAQAGLTAVVFIPAGKVALGKMAQTLAYGATTLAVKGDFDTCLKLIDAAGPDLGLYLLNSINPWRLEGQKAIVLEILQQLAWQVPDWLVLPGGNLGNTSAFGKALREALELGIIDKVPRIAVIQAAGASPFAQSFAEAFTTRPVVTADTVATAIRIGDPASFDRAVATIRLTNGVVSSVTDDEILAAKRLIDRAGVGCEPASAASVAGVRKLVAAGTIGRGETVVAVLTGHVLKDPEILLRPGATTPPIEVGASVEEIGVALKGLGLGG
ncbi:MAG: threonine synthase [Gemmatimonadota bacterium]